MATRTRNGQRPRQRVPVPLSPPPPGMLPAPAAAVAQPTTPVAATLPLGMDAPTALLEFISGDGISWLSAYVKSLPQWIDDATAELGDDLYDRMGHDGTVKGNLHALKAGILDDGLQLSSAVTDKHDPGYALAGTILAFCRRVLDELETGIDEVLWDMCDALQNGNRLAELVYQVVDYGDGPQYGLRALKVKPRRSYAFSLDPYNNLVGVQALMPGVAWPVHYGMQPLDPAQVPNLLPREKVAILTIRQKEDDPRGTSILRAAYQAWWLKMQAWPEYLKYLTQFASPLVAAMLGQISAPVTVDGATVSAAENLLNSLEQLRNGACIVLPNGTTLDMKQSSGEGQAFLHAFDYFDQQITIEMLSQTLATGAHKSNTRAAAQVHQDVLTTLVRQLKTVVTKMVRRQVLARLVAWNWGAEAARLYTPRVSLGQEEQPDLAALLTGLAPVQGFKLYPSQLPAVYEMLNLPAPDPEEVQADVAAQLAINKTVRDTGVPAAQAAALQSRMAQGQAGASAVGSPASGRQPGQAADSKPAPVARGASSEGSKQ